MIRIIAVALLIFGLGLVIAGAWISWDLMNTIMHMWEKGRDPSEFRFALPFFTYEYTHDNWTAAFDLAFTIQLIGSGMIAVGGVLFGRFLLEALLKRLMSFKAS